MPLLKNRPEVELDFQNPEHLTSIKVLLETGRLDPKFRFQVPEPFTSVVSYAIFMMATRYMKLMLQNLEEPKFDVNPSKDTARGSIRRFPNPGVYSPASKTKIH